MANKRGLGKGLQALIPNNAIENNISTQGSIHDILIKNIKPNSYQPRRQFSEEKINELAASIKENGVIQPIVVRRLGEDKYQLIAGERRWRACTLLNKDTIPAVIRDMDDKQVTEVALIENIQREDLNAIEEAWAYKTLIEEFSLTQEQLAQKIGKSRTAITNTLRLLNLECDVQDMLISGELTMGHVRALLAIKDGKTQLILALKAVQQGLSVRQMETTIKKMLEDKKPSPRLPAQQSPRELIWLQNKLEDKYNTKVSIKHGEKKGNIVIDYFDDEDLNRILEIMGILE